MIRRETGIQKEGGREIEGEGDKERSRSRGTCKTNLMFIYILLNLLRT